MNVIAKDMVRSVLDGKERGKVVEAIMSLGAGGLKPLEGGATIKPGAQYYLGASSSPQHIIITSVGKGMFSYRTYPYKKDIRIQTPIGSDLIAKGTATWIRTYGSHRPKEAAALKKALAGGAILKGDYKDFQQVEIRAVPSDKADWSKTRGNDPWYSAEQYGGVGQETKTDVYVINGDRQAYNNMKKDKNWKILGVKDA